MTIAELHVVFKSMKSEFESRLDTLQSDFENRIVALENTIVSKNIIITDLESKVAKNADTQETRQKEIESVVDNHQRFLEKTDSYQRENNVIIQGLVESADQNTDSQQVEDLLQQIGCPGVVPEKCVRLGKQAPVPVDGEDAPAQPPRTRPRLLLVVMKSLQEKTTVLNNASKLKDIEMFKKVYLKKDQTAYERKEWARLRDVLRREKGRPENAVVFVKMDYRRKCVVVGIMLYAWLSYSTM